MTQTSTRTLPELLMMLENAATPEEVFGRITTERDLRKKYRELASATHPDHHLYFTDVAAEAFKLLQAWYAEAQRRFKAQAFELVSRHYRYTAQAAPKQGDLCDVYTTAALPISGRPAYDSVVLKVVRQPQNNDLLSAEMRALKRVARELDGMPLRAHFPTLIDTFASRTASGELHHVNVLRAELELVTLADVIAAYPNGIDSADMAWMFNRVLVALAETHSLGLVHGAIVPEHVLIRPKDHNGMLIDWCYSVAHGEQVKAISPRNHRATAPEILSKRPATAATDIYMAAMTMLRLLGGDVHTKALPPAVPKPIRAFLNACLIQSPHRRPNSAWELFEQFGEILFRLYGPPTFRPFLVV